MRYQARQLTTVPVNDWVAVDFSFETLVMVMTMVGWSPSRPRLPWHLYSMSTDAVMQPEQVMEALLGRQRVLRALLDECAFAALTCPRIDSAASGQVGGILARVFVTRVTS